MPTQLGGPRFRCSQCARRFTRRSTSAFSGRAHPDDVIALAVRWYVRYRLSYTEVSEWLAERGIMVDQSTIYRWVQRYLPLFGAAARRYRQPVSPDWRVDETYARICGQWHYIYRAIDGRGHRHCRTQARDERRRLEIAARDAQLPAVVGAPRICAAAMRQHKSVARACRNYRNVLEARDERRRRRSRPFQDAPIRYDRKAVPRSSA